LECEPVVRRGFQGSEEVHGLGVEPAVLDEAVTAYIAREQRSLEIADFLAGVHIVVEVAEASSLGAVFDPVDCPAWPRSEIQRAAGGIVAVQCRGWSPDHVDGTISVRVDQIGSRKAVRLSDGETVVKDHQVADTEPVASIGPAYGNSDISGSIALLDR